MKLHDPFFIGSALTPALKIGDTTLSLLAVGKDADVDSYYATFELRGPGIDYVDNTLRSGVQGWRSAVEVFEAYLSFLEAAAEAMIYSNSENKTLFPHHVMLWCANHANEIAEARLSITSKDGSPRHYLIED